MSNNMSMPKVSIGKSSRKRSVFDKSHDVNTTAGFGFVQPLGCQPMIPGSTAKIGTKVFVRMAPMPLPTRGYLDFRLYHRFVPIEDIFEPFKNLLSGTTYNGASANYIPTEVPNIYQNDLILLFLNNAQKVTFYKKTSSNQKHLLVSTTADLNAAKAAMNTVYKFTFADSQDSPHWLYKPSMATDIATNAVTLSEADFIMSANSGTDNYLAAFRYGVNCKNLRKVLLGCGYQISLRYNRKVSQLPLIAYYKAYFDQFYPQRSATWTSTNIYKYLNIIMQSGVTQGFSTNDTFLLFRSFIDDLMGCYYTANPDYFTAQIANPNNPVVSTLPRILSASTNYGSSTYLERGERDLPHILISGSDTRISRVTLQMLNRFTKYVNKDGAIGKRINDLLFKYGAKPVHDLDSNYIGSSVTPCMIGDIMSTAATADANVGDFSGVGIGKDDKHRTFDFTTTTFGYWITLGAIVPQAGYCQCNNSNGALFHIGKWDFYNEDFDAIGYQVTSMDEFVGQSDYVDSSIYRKDPPFFGRIPRYSEIKVKPNLLNGDLSCRGTRSNLLPYTLDRFYQPDDVSFRSDETPGSGYTIHPVLRNAQIVSSEMRFIGKTEDEGNFNRIFYNSEGQHLESKTPEDNFIIHCDFEFKYIAPMLSLSDSFDTDAESDTTKNVEHA